MCGTEVLDKDGVGAAAVAAEMAVEAYGRGSTLAGELDAIYARYGFHATQVSYFVCHDPVKMRAVFERLRAMGDAPSCSIRIVRTRDLTTGLDTGEPDRCARLPTSSSSQMITYWFANGCTATLRTSGTEPKLKYYAEVRGAPNEARADAEARLAATVRCLVDELLRPQASGLEPRPG